MKMLLFAAAMLLVPSVALAQAECTKNNNQWSQFLDTGYQGLQVRCRCMDAGTYYGKWSYQFKNPGNQPAVFSYSFVYGSDRPGGNLMLNGHSVSPIKISSFGSCNAGLSLFVMAGDPTPPPPPVKKGAARKGTAQESETSKSPGK